MRREHWHSRNEAVPMLPKAVPAPAPKPRHHLWHRSAPSSQKGHKSFVFNVVPVPLRTISNKAKSLKCQRYHRYRPIEKVHTLLRACALVPLHAGGRLGERAAPVDSILSDGDSGKRRRRTAHGFQRFWLAVEVDEE